jgi:hypothetical protein
MGGIIAVKGPVSERDALTIKTVLGVVVPEFRKYIDELVRPLIEANDGLAMRVAELEAREAPTAPELPDIAAMVDEAVAALPAPEDGKSVTVEDLTPIVTEAVALAVDALPTPEDGKSVDPEAVRAMVADAVAALPVAKDGVGLAGLLIDRDGGLNATLSDGTIHGLGRVVGKDVDMIELERMVREMVDAIPRPRDGFGLDDFDTKMLEDGRTVLLTFTAGDLEYSHELHFPVMLYRGVYREGEGYQHGDVVTWAGSLWHAERATGAKPGGPDGDWQLAVKKGRDGKGVAQ